MQWVGCCRYHVIKYSVKGKHIDEYGEWSFNSTDRRFSRQLQDKSLYRFAVAAVNTAGDTRGVFSVH